MSEVMGIVDAVIALVVVAVVLAWKGFMATWFVVLPVAILGGVLWVRAGKCPKCSSHHSKAHSMFSRRGGIQSDSSISIDLDTGDWYSERYDRVCSTCGHRWLSGITSFFDDPRPIRKKILDGKAMRAIKEHARRGGTFLD